MRTRHDRDTTDYTMLAIAIVVAAPTLGTILGFLIALGGLK